MNLVEKVHRKQRTRHLVANKLTAALVVLRHIRDGELVSQKLIERAIKDLEVLMEFVDKSTKMVMDERGRIR